MKKYLQNRKTSEVICQNCNQPHLKPITEINRNNEIGRKMFCSRSCCISFNTKRRKVRSVNSFNIGQYSTNKIDIYTPFRYLFKCSKSRNKEISITLEDLLNQWNFQKGICPYSGVSLILPTSRNKLSYIYRASLDRIDSTKGYIKDNIQFVSTCMNLMKNNLTDKEIKHFCKLISDNYNSNHFED